MSAHVKNKLPGAFESLSCFSERSQKICSFPVSHLTLSFWRGRRRGGGGACPTLEVWRGGGVSEPSPPLWWHIYSHVKPSRVSLLSLTGIAHTKRKPTFRRRQVTQKLWTCEKAVHSSASNYICMQNTVLGYTIVFTAILKHIVRSNPQT